MRTVTAVDPFVRYLNTMAHATSNGGHNHVLIVENDETVLDTLESLARSEGFDPRTTWSGREALALLQSQPFDLVLVDSHLPDIYYGEFLKLASRHTRSLVVMQSGRPMPSSLRRHKMLGASDVVDKHDPKQLRHLLTSRHPRPASC